MSEQRLSDIEAQQVRTHALLENLCERMDEHAEASCQRHEKLERLLLNHDADKPGLVVRVDRLEQAVIRAQALVKKVGAAVVAAIGTALTSLFSR